MSGAEHKRSHRVAQVLQRELSELLTHGLKDPRVGFCTVTEVRLTDDLKSARIYVSVIGSSEAREATLAGLDGAKGFLRRELGQRTKLRYVPTLSFENDDTLDRAQRIDALLQGQEPDSVVDPGRSLEEIPVETSRSDMGADPERFQVSGPSTEKKSKTKRGRSGRRRNRRR